MFSTKPTSLQHNYRTEICADNSWAFGSGVCV